MSDTAIGPYHWRDLSAGCETLANHGLPSPLDVRISLDRLTHIVDGHVAEKDGPWEEWLSHELVTRLISWKQGEIGASEAKSLMGHFVRHLESEVRQSAIRPLVLAFKNRRSEETPDEDTNHILLVTPHGFVVILRWGDPFTLVTAFYTPGAAKAPPGVARWPLAVRDLVQTYAPWKAGYNRVLPSPDHEVTVLDDKGGGLRWIRSSFRFITLDTWGFEDEDAFSSWNHERMPTWPTAPAGGQDWVPQIRLKQRRRPWDEEYDG